jgi:hypothetical protein
MIWPWGGGHDDKVARFFLLQHTKTGKNTSNFHKIYQIAMKYLYQTALKYTDQMAIKYINVFHCKTVQDLPYFGFFVWKYTIW